MKMQELNIYKGDAVFVKSHRRETLMIALSDKNSEGNRVRMSKSARDNLQVGLG